MNGPNSESARTSRRSRRPSLATLISLVAVVIALTASAQALPGRNTVESNDIERNAVTTPKIRDQAVTTKKLSHGAVTTAKLRDGAVTPAKIRDHTMWAVVKGNGSAVQRSGVVSVIRQGPGTYSVRFAKSVLNRPIAATVYGNDAGDGQVNVRHCSTSHPLGINCPAGNRPELLLVTTKDSAGTTADRPFIVTAMPVTPVTVTSPLARPAPRGNG